MGQIWIRVEGSFRPNHNKVFGAQDHGHADAVAKTIEWLSTELLPEATALDHELHDRGDSPSSGFDRSKPKGEKE